MQESFFNNHGPVQALYSFLGRCTQLATFNCSEVVLSSRKTDAIMDASKSSPAANWLVPSTTPSRRAPYNVSTPPDLVNVKPRNTRNDCTIRFGHEFCAEWAFASSSMVPIRSASARPRPSTAVHQEYSGQNTRNLYLLSVPCESK